jgi:hypothetical protein
MPSVISRVRQRVSQLIGLLANFGSRAAFSRCAHPGRYSPRQRINFEARAIGLETPWVRVRFRGYACGAILGLLNVALVLAGLAASIAELAAMQRIFAANIACRWCAVGEGARHCGWKVVGLRYLGDRCPGITAAHQSRVGLFWPPWGILRRNANRRPFLSHWSASSPSTASTPIDPGPSKA